MKRPALMLALAALSGCSHLVVLHDPLTAAEHTDLGVAYEARGQLGLARKEYQRAVRLGPHLAQGWINLGNSSAAAARWGAAERSFRRALEADPAQPDALNNLACALIRSRRRGALGEAEAFARRAVGIGGVRDSVYRATLAEVKDAQVARPVAGP